MDKKDMRGQIAERPGGTARTAAVWVAACLVLVGSGGAYRVAAGHLERRGGAIRLPVALANVPMEVGGWRGRDVAMTEAVIKVAGNDDYVNPCKFPT